MFTIQSS